MAVQTRRSRRVLAATPTWLPLDKEFAPWRLVDPKGYFLVDEHGKSLKFQTNAEAHAYMEDNDIELHKPYTDQL